MVELLSTMAQLKLANNVTIKFEAIDPASGDPVSGVVITDAVLYGDNLTPQQAAELTAAVAPIWIPLPLDEQTDDS